MKRLCFMLAVCVLLTAGCGKLSPAPSSEPAGIKVQGPGPADKLGKVEISMNFNHQSGIASNQFAVWIEDSDGKFIKNLFATRFTADGGFKKRADALPVWVMRSGLADSAQDADAVSGATPKSGQQAYVWDCTDGSGQPVPAGDYHFLVEGTIFWKDGVLYDGVIKVGGAESSAKAEASFTTETAKQSDMITGVEAVYKPIGTI